MQNKDMLDPALICDERFCNYCFNTNSDDVKYWENWLAEHPAERSRIENQKLMLLLLASETGAQVVDEEYKKLQLKIQKSNIERPAYFSLVIRWSVAATLLLSSGLAYYFYQKTQPTQQIAKLIAPKTLPASNRANLTLANGQIILLNDTKQGELAVQPGVSISNNRQGQITYTAIGDSESLSGAVSYNTLTTPSGAQYQVILPDGSHVWLNNLSTLKYPTRFAGNKREVTITGEGYFEIIHNPNMPFFVISRQQKIQVVGTHFNVRCYYDDPITRTTLLKGKVLITAGARKQKLTPGETLVLEQKGQGIPQMKVTYDPDAEGAIAWKSGMLHFHEANIQEITRVFRRWYDVDMESAGTGNKRLFSGDIARDQPLSAALEILKYKGIYVTVQGRKIIIDENLSQH